MATHSDTNPLQLAKDLTARVYERYGKQLFSYLRRRLRNPQDTEDLQQEVYMRLLRVPDAELIANPQALMFSIAAHVSHEFNQRARRARVTADSDKLQELDEHPEPENVVRDPLIEQLHAREQLQRALARMQPTWRTAFILHRLAGHTHAEVAQQMGISPLTVKEYMHKAVIVLRDDILEAQRERQLTPQEAADGTPLSG